MMPSAGAASDESQESTANDRLIIAELLELIKLHPTVRDQRSWTMGRSDCMLIIVDVCVSGGHAASDRFRSY